MVADGARDLPVSIYTGELADGFAPKQSSHLLVFNTISNTLLAYHSCPGRDIEGTSVH